MSAANGGRGTPPVPPEGHGPPEQQEIPILKEVTYHSQQTTAQRMQDGSGAVISFIVLEGGQPVQHRYIIGEPGKKALLEELAGGLALP
jgi:hypothetical protein